jgi:hypothetical protein
VFIEIGNIDNQSHQIVAIGDVGVSPMSFNSLRLVTRRAELLDNFQHGISKPLARYFAAVIELEREQNLVPPPIVANRSLYP